MQSFEYSKLVVNQGNNAKHTVSLQPCGSVRTVLHSVTITKELLGIVLVSWTSYLDLVL